MSDYLWESVDIVVPPTILERFVSCLVAFANEPSIVLGRMYPCPLTKVKGEDAGKPYDGGTVQRQSNDVLHGKLGAEARKAHPELKNVHTKRVGDDTFWYRTK